MNGERYRTTMNGIAGLGLCVEVIVNGEFWGKPLTTRHTQEGLLVLREHQKHLTELVSNFTRPKTYHKLVLCHDSRSLVMI